MLPNLEYCPKRITQLHRDTILRLLVLAGERCIALMDTRMRGLHCEHVQSDEIWTFVAKKQRHVKADDPAEFGDAWVFVAIDADSKLIPSYTVGKRNRETTYQFLNDLRSQQCFFFGENHRCKQVRMFFRDRLVASRTAEAL